MALGARLKHFRTKAGFTLEQLSERSGVDVGTISALENRDSTRSKYAKDLARGLNLPLESLLGDIGDHALEAREQMPRYHAQEMQNVGPAELGDRRVPIIDHVQAGDWTAATDPYALGDAWAWLATDLELSRSAFALQIKGDSMLPEFKEGDRVIIDPEVNPQPGDYVVAKNGEEEATFKKYRPRGMNERGDIVFELVPLNDDFATLRSDITPIRIIGTMVEHRKYRKKRSD